MKAITMAGFNMSRVVETECKANQSIVDTNTAAKNSLISLSAKNAAITVLASRQAMNIKGYATNKNKEKKELAQLGNALAGILFAFADEKGLVTLRDNMKFSYSGLYYQSADGLVSDCTNIYEALNANVADLGDYGVTVLMVSNFKGAIDDFELLVPQPRQKQSEKKTDTENLDKAVSDVKKFLKNRMDKVMAMFKVSNPEFVKNYFNARIIVDPKTDKTKINVLVVDVEGNPIGGAEVFIIELGISGVTNNKGVLKLVALKHGTYTVHCRVEEYVETQQADVVVKQGQTTKVKFDMVKKVPSPIPVPPVPPIP